MNWESVRREFPALEHWTYLNTATYGQLPRCAVEAVRAHFAHRDELACSDFITWYDDMDRIRGSIARLIHCEAGDIAFVQNASTALATLISGLNWEPGDRVVTLADEFPNNLYAVGALARRGVEAIECPWEQFYGAINERTRLVVLSSASYVTGFAPPLEEISEFLKRRGVLLFVDGTQTLGALQFDCARVRPSMFAVHGYKWLLCPDGAGFMYVDPELRERLEPRVIGWRSHRDWRGVDNLHHGAPEFSDKAEKYEGGMLPFAVLYGMGASVEMMLQIGPAKIEARVLELADRTREVLHEYGGKAGRHGTPIVSARFEGRDVSAMARSLQERRIVVAARHGYLRVSPHFYNNEEDLAVLARELHALQGALQL